MQTGLPMPELLPASHQMRWTSRARRPGTAPQALLAQHGSPAVLIKPGMHAWRASEQLLLPAAGTDISSAAQFAAGGTQGAVTILHPPSSPEIQQPTGMPAQSKPASKAGAKRLMRQLKACSSPQQLQQLHEAAQHEMDHVHVCAAITHLAQLLGYTGVDSTLQMAQASEQLHVTALAGVLLQRVSAVRALLGPRECANVVWALARLHGAGLLPPEPSLHPSTAAQPTHTGATSIGCLLGSAGSGSGSLPAHPLPQANSAGGTGVSPTVHTLVALAWGHAAAMNGQELSNTLYAAHLLGARPPPEACNAVMQRLEHVRGRVGIMLSCAAAGWG